MTAFRVGQRVRKARGLCVGLTGVVADIDPFDERSLGVRVDSGGVGLDGEEKPLPFLSGTIVYGYPDEHEPILDQHQPCESEFKETLDKLLEAVSA